MEPNIAPTTQETQYTQVTVDVPQDRVAEFHSFFGRFLGGAGSRRGRRGRHHGRGHHGRGCAARRESVEQSEPTVEATEL